VALSFKTVIDEITHAADFKRVNWLFAENVNLTDKDGNTTIDEVEYRWNIHLVSYDTFLSRLTPSSNGLLSRWSWSFGILDEF